MDQWGLRKLTSQHNLIAHGLEFYYTVVYCKGERGLIKSVVL